MFPARLSVHHDGSETLHMSVWNIAFTFQMMKFDLVGSEMPIEMTPLAVASSHGMLKIVQALVKSNAEVNSVSEVRNEFARVNLHIFE